jgi:TAG lipase/lysophosphatidylethanolamine acyltransferase
MYTFEALCHLGVAKALFENEMLPKVLCGSYLGALMASIICAKSDEELNELFYDGHLDIEAFNQLEHKSSLQRRMIRLFKQGRIFDVNVLERCAKDNIGDITFQVIFF